MKLPSKKVLSLLVLIVSAVVFTVLVFGKKNTAGQQIIASTLKGGEKLSIPENSGWQNILNTQTNPPNDYATSSEASGLTDKVSVLMMSKYLSLKQNGDLNQDDIENIVNEASSYTKNTELKKIKESDLNIVNNSDKESIAKYGEDLGNILKKHKPSQSKNEILILQEALAQQNPDKINELEEAIDIYETIAFELKKMPVPKIFIKAHLDTVNGMNNLGMGLGEIKKVFQDPMFALVGLSTYQSGGDMFIQSVRASSDFIKKNNIIYKQGSGGYYLLYGI